MVKKDSRIEISGKINLKTASPFGDYGGGFRKLIPVVLVFSFLSAANFEVKSGVNVESKSLRKFKELYADAVGLRLRFSLNTLRLDGDLLNIPLFMADQVDRLIALAEKERWKRHNE